MVYSWFTAAGEGVPGSFGLDSKKDYYSFKSEEAIRLDLWFCKYNASPELHLT